MINRYANFLKSKSSKGFTLIELLVVVSIIAVLVSILIPSISTGIETAESSKCKSNQRQAVSLMISHSLDAEDLLPYSSNQAPGRPNSFFFYHVDENDLGVDVLVCPSAKFHGTNPWGGPIRSIGLNTLVAPYDYQNTGQGPVQPRTALSSIKRPSDVVMFGDCAQFTDANDPSIGFRVLPYINGWWYRNSAFTENNAANPVTTAFIPQTGFWDDIPLIPMRHGGYANLANVDGSIRRVSHISQLLERNFTISY